MAISKIQSESMNLADTYAFTHITGGILQCVAMHLTTRTTMNHASNTTVDFHNVTITPKAAGSKFLFQGI